MAILRNLVILTACFFSFGKSEAQTREQWCGTKMTPQSRQAQSSIVPGYFGCNYINRIERTLQISLHLAQNSSQSVNISEGDISDVLSRLNADFAPCGLQFAYCFRDTMPDNRFDSLDVLTLHNEEIQMTALHYEPNTINIYLVDTIGLEGSPGANGYAYFPGGIDVIVIEKNGYNGDSDTPTHEMGHFFGLYHTFETDTGIELANGSNCQLAGDLVCDTEADPDPDGSADINDQCNYNGALQQDANGDWFVPPTDNYMSYYPSDCKCRFTPQQYNRMLEQYLLLRSYLW